MSIYSALEKNEREYSDLRLLRELLARLKSFKKEIIITSFLLIGEIGLYIFTPWIGSSVIDHLLEENPNLQTIWTLGITYTIVTMLVWIFAYLTAIVNGKLIPLFLENIQMEIFDQLQILDLSFYDHNQRGELNTRVINDSKELSSMIQVFSNFISNILISISIFSFLIWFDSAIALITLGACVFIFVSIFLFRKFVRRTSRSYRKIIGEVNSSLVESVEGIHIAKNYGQELNMTENFEQITERFKNAKTKQVITNILIWPIFGLIAHLTEVLIISFWSYNIFIDLSSGTLYNSLLYISQVFYPILSLGTFYFQLQQGFAAFERIMVILDTKPQVNQRNSKKIQKISNSIEIKNLFFSYNEGIPIFQGLNLKIKSRERIAIVGHTGSGKTSLISLLTRFYEYQNGEIIIDGIDLRDLDLKSYRNLIGVVTQDVFLFNGTIEENIKYGRETATELEVWNAIKAVHAEEFIDYLPNGLKTMVGERGKNLSMGQRQLISFARTILRNPQILILDEATSSVDAYTEAMIQEALNELFTNRTSIVIAHRLSTIINADRILVMEQGNIVESGSHNQLLEQNGKYSELYKQYFEHQSLDWQEIVLNTK